MAPQRVTHINIGPCLSFALAFDKGLIAIHALDESGGWIFSTISCGSMRETERPRSSKAGELGDPISLDANTMEQRMPGSSRMVEHADRLGRLELVAPICRPQRRILVRPLYGGILIPCFTRAVGVAVENPDMCASGVFPLLPRRPLGES